MQIPSLPTDNLYKFLALTGLFVLFGSIGLYQYRLHIHEVENVNIRVGIENLKYATDNYFRDLEYITDQISSTYDEIEKNPESLNREKTYALLDKYKNEFNEKRISRTTLKEKSMDLRLMSEMADASVLATNRMIRWLIFSCLVGLVITISGFTLWYNRLQKYQDKKLQNEVNNMK